MSGDGVVRFPDPFAAPDGTEPCPLCHGGTRQMEAVDAILVVGTQINPVPAPCMACEGSGRVPIEAEEEAPERFGFRLREIIEGMEQPFFDPLREMLGSVADAIDADAREAEEAFERQLELQRRLAAVERDAAVGKAVSEVATALRDRMTIPETREMLTPLRDKIEAAIKRLAYVAIVTFDDPGPQVVDVGLLRSELDEVFIEYGLVRRWRREGSADVDDEPEPTTDFQRAICRDYGLKESRREATVAAQRDEERES